MFYFFNHFFKHQIQVNGKLMKIGHWLWVNYHLLLFVQQQLDKIIPNFHSFNGALNHQEKVNAIIWSFKNKNHFFEHFGKYCLTETSKGALPIIQDKLMNSGTSWSYKKRGQKLPIFARQLLKMPFTSFLTNIGNYWQFIFVRKVVKIWCRKNSSSWRTIKFMINGQYYF